MLLYSWASWAWFGHAITEIITEIPQDEDNRYALYSYLPAPHLLCIQSKLDMEIFTCPKSWAFV